MSLFLLSSLKKISTALFAKNLPMPFARVTLLDSLSIFCKTAEAGGKLSQSCFNNEDRIGFSAGLTISDSGLQPIDDMISSQAIVTVKSCHRQHGRLLRRH